MPKTIRECIYERLCALGLDFENVPDYAESKASGFMDLGFDLLQKEPGCIDFTLCQYYEKDGIPIPNPDMGIRARPTQKSAEALSYQDQFNFWQVYPEEGGGRD